MNEANEESKRRGLTIGARIVSAENGSGVIVGREDAPDLWFGVVVGFDEVGDPIVQFDPCALLAVDVTAVPPAPAPAPAPALVYPPNGEAIVRRLDVGARVRTVNGRVGVVLAYDRDGDPLVEFPGGIDAEAYDSVNLERV